MKDIGLAVIGCGTIGRIRAELARDYPGVKWLGLCDIRKDVVFIARRKQLIVIVKRNAVAAQVVEDVIFNKVLVERIGI